MREECGGSALLDTINIGSDRIGSAGRARKKRNDRVRLTHRARTTRTEPVAEGERVKSRKEESKDESMNESTDNNAERSNDIQLNRKPAKKYTRLFKRRLYAAGMRSPALRSFLDPGFRQTNRSGPRGYCIHEFLPRFIDIFGPIRSRSNSKRILFYEDRYEKSCTSTI